MAITTQVLFNRPQQEIAGLLRVRLAQCESVSIVSGFATVEGFDAIFPTIRSAIKKLKRLVVGAATYRAYDLLDDLLRDGVPADRLMVHLGHTRATGSGAKHSFYRYHPMLHSKLYLMDMKDGMSCAFVGSHNMTGFAMHGLNGEAAVLLEGPTGAPEFQAIREHIDECAKQSVIYSPSMKEAFAWWTVQFLEGLKDKANDAPRDGEGQPTIVVICVRPEDTLPQADEIIYFEIPSALGQIDSLRAEVHVYVFDRMPASPSEALATLGSAKGSYWCRTLGLEREQGGVELRADWQVVSTGDPRLVPVARPFRPRAAPGMQQVRVKVHQDVFGDFEYLFTGLRVTWEPELSEGESIRLPDGEIPRVVGLKVVPPEDKEWYLVRGLSPAESGKSEQYLAAMKMVSPEGGGFILFSRRRRKRE